MASFRDRLARDFYRSENGRFEQSLIKQNPCKVIFLSILLSSDRILVKIKLSNKFLTNNIVAKSPAFGWKFYSIFSFPAEQAKSPAELGLNFFSIYIT